MSATESEVAALRERIADFETIVENQASRIEQQAARIDDLEEENEDKQSTPIEVQSDDKNPTLKDIWIAGLPFGKIIDKVETKINGFGKVEERINDLETEAAQTDESEPRDNDRSLTVTHRS